MFGLITEEKHNEMELLFKTYLQELDYKYDEDVELF